MKKNLKTTNGEPVTVSIGISMVNKEVNPVADVLPLQQTAGELRDELIRKADLALYRAKSSGKNMVCLEE